IFNIATNTWTVSPYPLPVPSCALAAAVDPKGLIYAIGGTVGAVQYAADVYSYDPTTPGWAKRAPLLIGRASGAADTGPDGLVYAIGGSSAPSGAVFADVEAYTFDRCDYIEHQIDVVSTDIGYELYLLEAPELSPQQRAAVLKQLAGLQAQ